MDTMIHRILVVDDELPLLSLFDRLLTHHGYQVTTAASRREAIEALQSGERFHTVLLDVNLPDGTGATVVTELLEIDGAQQIIMVSGINNARTAAQCLQAGAVDYLTKPVEQSELLLAIRTATRQGTTRHPGETTAETILHALISTMEAKDPFLVGHSRRVASTAASIAHCLDLSDQVVEDIRLAGHLHDLGMIGVREGVLHKQGRLTADEYRHVQEHVTIGARILASIPHLRMVAQYVRHHHEHVDGSGYPDGLTGRDIPVGARVLAVAEIYDALTTRRPYQEAMTPPQALERLRELSGTKVDPDIVQVLAEAVEGHQALVFLNDDGDKDTAGQPSLRTSQAYLVIETGEGTE